MGGTFKGIKKQRTEEEVQGLKGQTWGGTQEKTRRDIKHETREEKK